MSIANIKSALILGLGFRPDVKADICSPAYALKEALQKRGVGVWLHDPLYAAEELAAKGFTQNVATPYERGFDVVILNTAHQAFKSLDFSRLASLGCKLFVDGRNCCDAARVVSGGLAYRGVGKGETCSCSPPRKAVGAAV